MQCGTVLGDEFAAMLKRRPPKQSQNALESHLDPFSRATSKWPIDRVYLLFLGRGASVLILTSQLPCYLKSYVS